MSTEVLLFLFTYFQRISSESNEILDNQNSFKVIVAAAADAAASNENVGKMRSKTSTSVEAGKTKYCTGKVLYRWFFKCGTLHVSSLSRGNANLLCILYSWYQQQFFSL